jgi:hypothetical protein
MATPDPAHRAAAAVLPCPRCGPDFPCALQGQDAGPCRGQIRGYYLDWETLVHLCEGHIDVYTLP